MELSPVIYHTFVRPKWFLNRYLYKLFEPFDFRNTTILDFGCGVGSNAYIFPSAGYIGLDCDRKRIKYAGKHHPNHKFIVSNADRIPLPDHSIDFIIIISVLHHISDDTLGKYLREFRRILRKNGRILVMEPCLYPNAPLCNWFMQHIDKGNYIRYEKQYLHLFHKAGYRTKVALRFNQLHFYNKIVIAAKPR